MWRKRETQIFKEDMSYLAMNEPTTVLEELELLSDGTYRIGNSFETTIEEAKLLILNRKAKHVSCSIGIIPEWFNGEGV